MKGKGRFIRNMERDWKMKNEAKKNIEVSMTKAYYIHM